MAHAPGDDDLGIDHDPAPRPFMAEFAGITVRTAPARGSSQWKQRFVARKSRGAQLSLPGGGWRHDDSGRSRDRRVVVTTRIARLDPARAGMPYLVMRTASAEYLRYLERDGVTRDGDSGCCYSATEEAADGRAFLERGRADRNQYRVVIAAEDGAALGDLRPFARELMRRIEGDLKTRLDWIAVDHFNTGRPHTHVLVRGVTDGGKTLYIATDYLKHGPRHRASELATEILGPQNEIEASERLAAEVGAERLTRLDRTLIAKQRDHGVVDLRPRQWPHSPGNGEETALLRLRRLERYGLADETEPMRFVLSPHAEATLQAMAARRDAVAAVHRALQEHGLATERDLERYVLHGTGTGQRLEGRVIAKGLSGDGAGARVHLVVDGTDGRVHHVEFAGAAEVEEVQRGMIVAVAPPRAGHDPGRGVPAVRILATLDLARQIDSAGPTWLDRELVASGRIAAAATGFGAELAEALARRAERLAATGHAQRRPDGALVVSRDLVATLEREEAERRGREMARRRGRTFVPLRAGAAVAGMLHGPVDLAGGRWAMIDDGVSFSIVPWQAPLGRCTGRYISGIARSDGVDWSFGRKPSLAP